MFVYLIKNLISRPVRSPEPGCSGGRSPSAEAALAEKAQRSAQNHGVVHAVCESQVACFINGQKT